MSSDGSAALLPKSHIGASSPNIHDSHFHTSTTAMARPQMRAHAAASSAIRQASTASVPVRVVASLLLSRPPLVLPSLSDFEKAHYAYNKQLKTALSEPFDSTAYFAKGSQAERTFLERDRAKKPSESSSDSAEADKDSEAGLQSLQRQKSRTLYLLLRKDRQKGGKGAWQFRMS